MQLSKNWISVICNCNHLENEGNMLCDFCSDPVKYFPRTLFWFSLAHRLAAVAVAHPRSGRPNCLWAGVCTAPHVWVWIAGDEFNGTLNLWKLREKSAAPQKQICKCSAFECQTCQKKPLSVSTKMEYGWNCWRSSSSTHSAMLLSKKTTTNK